ncbi:hypothetical protein CH276_14090 [Rhodococcus sp. 06-470-2]|uniref:hypothetical protein n=1 Tax=unclassified Rhodococcus (in: high G+C Gram-positive bacteria) TaxID=192944 RepID=UPI000B9C6030|nr:MULTISPECIES: hypothetical protein [unclassified Rhodococcus (in: high G+C Gram-positive bacteria)]OZC62746.1 hypothetical protein CH276_14090 [Rhodococcus sp. 06-470-2]OZE71723.1 hypothetical protein CH265_01570 [Rhodococcus sp. 05-2221-1B]
MTAAEVFQTKPEKVQAMQFKGWRNAVDIQRFALCSVFVPAGYEHHLRYEREHDRSNGHVYEENAPGFLAVLTAGGDCRVNEGGWVIVDSAGAISVATEKAFAEAYELVIA